MKIELNAYISLFILINSEFTKNYAVFYDELFAIENCVTG
jgi:hypothetical protein